MFLGVYSSLLSNVDKKRKGPFVTKERRKSSWLLYSAIFFSTVRVAHLQNVGIKFGPREPSHPLWRVSCSVGMYVAVTHDGEMVLLRYYCCLCVEIFHEQQQRVNAPPTAVRCGKLRVVKTPFYSSSSSALLGNK